MQIPRSIGRETGREIGREREFAAISTLLDAARAGSGGTLVLIGELGIGKSTLLAAAGSACGFTVLACRGHAAESHLPLTGVQDLLRPLGRQPAAGAGLGREVTDLLAHAAGERPVLCLVDDVHLVDPASVQALTFAARRLDATPVVFLFTTTGPGAAARQLCLSGFPRLQLSPISPEQSRDLLLELGIGSEDATRCAELAQGNPLALHELARGEQCLAPDSLLRADYLARLAELGPDTRWLLLLAAADVQLDAPELILAAQASQVDLHALTAAESAGLIAITGTTVTLPLPLSRQVCYEEAPLAHRQAAHLLLAQICHRHRLRRAVHLAAAACGPDPKLAAELEAAALQATTQDRYSQAASALERAAQLTVRPDDAAKRLAVAARYAWLGGSSQRARTLLDGAGSSPGAEILAGEIELRSGATSSTLDPLLAAADRFAGSHRELAVVALMRAAEAVCFSGEHGRFEEIAARAEPLRHHGDSAQLELAFEYIAGLAATFVGRHALAAQALRRAVRLGEQIDDAAALTAAGAASLLLADDHTAHRTSARAVELARVAGEVSALPIALEVRACAEYWLGRHDIAEATSVAGLAVARASGQDNYAADHLGMLAVLAAIRGDRETCLDRLRELATPAGAGHANRPRALSRWAHGVLDVIAGRPTDALARLASIADPLTGQGHVVVQVMATPWLVEAAVRGNDTGLACDALAAFDRWAQSTGDPVRRALSARCHALLAPRGSELAVQQFETALQLHLGGEADFERARTELLFGHELRRARRARDAREHLHRALETFQLLAAPAWVEQASAELRAAGESRAAPGLPETLTAQQSQIARLVADGATNREVAAQLFLSPRTVDHHMRNIFTRLGIRSRIELTKVLI